MLPIRLLPGSWGCVYFFRRGTPGESLHVLPQTEAPLGQGLDVSPPQTGAAGNRVTSLPHTGTPLSYYFSPVPFVTSVPEAFSQSRLLFLYLSLLKVHVILLYLSLAPRKGQDP